jgi:hypothetical protein
LYLPYPQSHTLTRIHTTHKHQFTVSTGPDSVIGEKGKVYNFPDGCPDFVRDGNAGKQDAGLLQLVSDALPHYFERHFPQEPSWAYQATGLTPDKLKALFGHMTRNVQKNKKTGEEEATPKFLLKEKMSPCGTKKKYTIIGSLMHKAWLWHVKKQTESGGGDRPAGEKGVPVPVTAEEEWMSLAVVLVEAREAQIMNRSVVVCVCGCVCERDRET